MLGSLLQLLGTGLGMWGAQAGSDAMDASKRAQFSTEMQGKQQGIDMSTPQGIQAYAASLQQDPRTFSGGTSMLDASFNRAQQQGQFDQSFNNLSADQQAQLEQQKQMEFMRMAAQRQFTPQQLGERQMTLFNGFNKDLGTFRDQGRFYDQLMATINNPKSTSLDSMAALKNFVKVIDPTLITRGENGQEELSQNASGYVGQIMDELNKVGAKGFTPDTRLNIANSATAMLNGSLQTGRAMAQNYANLAQGNPMQGIPATDLSFIDHSFLQDRQLTGELAAIQAAAQGKGIAPGSTGKIIRGKDAPAAFKARLVPLDQWNKQQDASQ